MAARSFEPEHRNHVWSYDFVFDRTEDGRQLKFMPVLDEHTRESLALEVERSITGDDVVDVLAYLFQVHGEPEFIRSDNGPEFVSTAVKNWLDESGGVSDCLCKWPQYQTGMRPSKTMDR